MLKVSWAPEEAIALLDLYLKNGSSPNISRERLERLSHIYHNRAKALGLQIDEKFRNLAGLKLQL